MRVVCIDDSCQPNKRVPKVKRGVIYTVVEKITQNDLTEQSDGFINEAGDYYVLFECGEENAYHHSMFLPINEDQQDEVEMQRDYKLLSTQ